MGHLHRALRRRGGRRAPGQPLVAARFIALEGIDGSGKSTQAALLESALALRRIPVVRTREPGGTPVGEAVRQIVLGVETGEMALVTEALLFAASRAEHVRRLILPALEAGTWVISDRFLDSSLAYQGAARGLGIDAVLAINAAAVEGCLPTLSLVIDTPAEITTQRRCATPDRIEAEGERFQQKVAGGYRELAGRFPERVRLIPGDGAPDEVHARVVREVAALL